MNATRHTAFSNFDHRLQIRLQALPFVVIDVRSADDAVTSPLPTWLKSALNIPGNKKLKRTSYLLTLCISVAAPMTNWWLLLAVSDQYSSRGNILQTYRSAGQVFAVYIAHMCHDVCTTIHMFLP